MLWLSMSRYGTVETGLTNGIISVSRIIRLAFQRFTHSSWSERLNNQNAENHRNR